MLNLEQIKKRLQRYPYVSFDIFDTLLGRNVKEYSDIFDLVQQEARYRYGLFIDSFKSVRIAAEQAARNRHPNREIRLSEIYAEMIDIEEEDKALLMQIEKDTEKRELRPNREARELFEYCKQAHKTILIISDMYLDQEFLLNCLKENGFVGVERSYISCEVGKTKRTGELFWYVLSDLQIRADQLLHVGDNWRSDYVMARRFGIHAIHINMHRFERERIRKERSCLQDFISSYQTRFSDQIEWMGFSIFGPLLFGFVQFIIAYAQENRCEKVYFASRDGYIMKKAYDIFEEEGQTQFPSQYFLASRRSLQVPMLACMKGGFQEYFTLISVAPFLTLRNAFSRMGYVDFTSEDANRMMSVNKVIEIMKDETQYVQEKRTIIAQAREEEKHLTEYLEQTGFLSQTSLFIDVGWKCSSQKALSEIAKSKNCSQMVKGVYLGVHSEAQIAPSARQGYLFCWQKNDAYYTVMGAMSIIELFFCAPHGSVHRYGENGAILDAYEYDDDHAFSYEISCMNRLHSGAISFIKEYLKHSQSACAAMHPEVASFSLKRLMKMPTKSEMELLGRFRFHGADGVQSIVKETGIKHYLRHPTKLLQDYGESGWKVGFLCSLLHNRLISYWIFYLTYRTYKG